MWGRLKRRIMRSKTGSGGGGGGGIYGSSQDEESSEGRDLRDRDFREDLDDESRENANWKEGKSGRKIFLTKTPFPNLDRCSCGTPGGKDASEIQVRSETLRRKSDFISGRDSKSKGHLANKSNNEYTSTSTGPGTRTCSQDGEETRIRASTSTGQIPQIVNEQKINERNAQRMNASNSSSMEIRRRRMAYSDEDDDEDEDDEDDEDMEEGEESEDAADQLNPSTSEPLRNSSQSNGTKCSSNSSDYTSLAFDLNYVKVSPPKLRRRRKKTSSSEASVPLMIRRERPTPKPLPEQPQRSSQKPPTHSVSASSKTLEGVDAGLPSGRSKGDNAFQPSPPEHRTKDRGTEATKQSPGHSVAGDNSKLQSGYISWGDALHLFPQNVTAAKETVKCESNVEPVTRTIGDTSTSGSLLQFTFTVRLDNDVIRATRRDSDQATGGPSLVSGRVDILSPGLRSTFEDIGVRRQVQPSGLGSDGDDITTQRQCAEMNKDNIRQSETNILSNAKREKETKTAETFSQMKNMETEMVEKATEKEEEKGQFQVMNNHRTVEGNSGSADNNNTQDFSLSNGNRRTVFASSCKQQTLVDFPVTHGTTVNTTAVVHKSASEVDREEKNNDKEKMETKVVDSNQMNSKPNDDEGKGFDEIDFAAKRQFHFKQSNAALTSDSDSEQTHMNWDEVMQEAESLGIPLTRPMAHCRDCSKDRTTGQCIQTSNTSPSKQSDNYWICSNCTDLLQNQPLCSSRKTAAKTSSPFKEKFKLQTIFGGKRTKDEKTGRTHEVMSYPGTQRDSSPSSKYKTMPASAAAAAAASVTRSSPDFHKSIWSTNRNGKQTSRGRSMSPALTVRCGTSSSSSPKASSSWHQCRGDTRGQQRISHLCSPPQLRCRFPSCGRTTKSTTDRPSSASENNSTHISSSEILSSSPSKRRPNTIDRHFLKSLAQLMSCSWYWGSLSFESAEVELCDRVDGCFLVRDSSDDRYILSISFRSQKSTHHIRIERHDGMFSFSSEQGLHESPDIVEFIETAIELSQGGQCLYYLRPRTPSSPPVPVLLLHPLSRFAH